MRRSLTFFIAIHWTAAFAVLAFLAVLDASSGAGHLARMLGGGNLHQAVPSLAGPAVAFALVAAVFLWFSLTALVGGDPKATRDVARQATLVGVFLAALMALAALADPTFGSYPAYGAMIAGLSLSSLIVAGPAGHGDEAAGLARLMAAGAAYGALQPRPGRPIAETLEDAP